MHSSYICWIRGTKICENLGRILFARANGEQAICDCKCHR